MVKNKLYLLIFLIGSISLISGCSEVRDSGAYRADCYDLYCKSINMTYPKSLIVNGCSCIDKDYQEHEYIFPNESKCIELLGY